MYKVPLITGDDERIRPAAGVTSGTLYKTASYTITDLDILNGGGQLAVVIASAGAAVDLTLPSAVKYAGTHITMYKPSGNTNACAFLATGNQTIEGGTANKRWQNATNEQGSCTIWSDGSNWRIKALKGTWAANNT